MNAQNPVSIEAKPPKLRANLSRALDVIAIEGQTQREAARRAGIHEDSLSRALARPEVRAELERRQTEAAFSLDALKGMAKASALRVGLDLMHNAKDERVKARMVELFAGETRGPAVVVQMNQNGRAGYHYPKPNSQSGADAGQVIEGTAETVKPE